MPGRDNTGPLGNGPMTGRRMGNCAEETSRDYAGFRRFGFGRGRGFRRSGKMSGNYEGNSFLDLISDLKDQISSLKNEITDLKKNKANE